MFDNIKNYLFLSKIKRQFKRPLKKLYSRKITKYNLIIVRLIYKNLARRYSLSVKQLFNYLPLKLEIDKEMEMAYGLCEAKTIIKSPLFGKKKKLRVSTIYLNGKDVTTTTFIHEFGHYLRFLIEQIAYHKNKKALFDFRNIVDLTRSRAEAYRNKDDNYWNRGGFTEEEEENFAKSWEQYLKDGIPPNKKFKKIFTTFKKYIYEDMYKRNERKEYEFYENLEVKITPERKQYFDELIIGKNFKKKSLLTVIVELYVYLGILYLIYRYFIENNI